LKPERWGSLLVQEKYREEIPVTETSILYNNNNNNNNNNNSKAILQECNAEKKLCMAWIDYQRAFDRVPQLDNQIP
jgi:hypothetical protein